MPLYPLTAVGPTMLIVVGAGCGVVVIVMLTDIVFAITGSLSVKAQRIVIGYVPAVIVLSTDRFPLSSIVIPSGCSPLMLHVNRLLSNNLPSLA
jgi:hypothetical protein